MSDTITSEETVSAEGQVQEQPTKNETMTTVITDKQPLVETVEKNDDKEALKKELREDIATFYMEKIETLKKQVQGQDKKNSELQRKVKEFEKRELTDAEKQELEAKEIKEAWQKIYREKAIANFNFVKDETDNIDFSDYFFGESEDEVFGKAERLKTWMDKQIAKMTEKNVEARLSQGYVPKSAGQSGDKKDDLSNMDRKELGEYAKKVSQMPSGDEKNKLLELLSNEQFVRFKN